jgi:hypothetical protein
MGALLGGKAPSCTRRGKFTQDSESLVDFTNTHKNTHHRSINFRGWSTAKAPGRLKMWYDIVVTLIQCVVELDLDY